MGLAVVFIALFSVATAKPVAAITTCGDGITEGTEGCDDMDLDEEDGCTSFCTICGDEVTDTGEECDAGGANSNVTPDDCRLSCVLPTCGDGVTDTREE